MAEWFYGDNGLQMGPVNDADLHSLIAAGRIGPSTLLWRDGMPGWMPFDQVLASGGIGLATSPGFPSYTMVNPATSGLAVASLVCGIVGLVTCLLVPGIPAVICGHLAMSRIANSAIPMGGRGMALAGLVCGYLSLLIMVSFIVMITFAMASSP